MNGFDESTAHFEFVPLHDALAARIGATLVALRARRPKVHAITGPVAQTLTANGLGALGAITTLTINQEEISDFVMSSDAILLNLGMMDRERFEILPIAAQISAETGKPFVIDPVFADRSPRRRNLARSMLGTSPKIVKLNQREAEAFSRDIPTTATEIVTGPVDRIRLGKREAKLANGHVMMEPTAATGCLLGGILAACMTVEDDPFMAAITGVSIINIAAEIAGERSAGPGSFAVNLIDELANLDASAIQRRLKINLLRDEA